MTRKGTTATGDVARNNESLERAYSELLERWHKSATEQEQWESLLDENSPLPGLLAEFEAEAEKDMEELVDAKGDDVKRLQADIRSRRKLAGMIRAKANPESVSAAEHALREFEDANALFMTDLRHRQGQEARK